MSNQNDDLERIVQTIENPEDYREITVERGPNGITVYGVPIQRKLTKTVRIGRRAFVIGVPASSVVAYYALGINKILESIGKMVDAGYQFSEKFSKIGVDVFKELTGELGLDKLVKQLQDQDTAQEEKMSELYSQFLQVYSANQSLAEKGRRVWDESGRMTKSINDALRETPIGEIEKTGPYGLREKIQDGIQGLIGRKTGDAKYIENFRELQKQGKQVDTALAEMETQIKKALEAGDKAKAEKIMSDYINTSNARKAMLDNLSPNNLERLERKYFERFEQRLRDETGGAFADYAKIGNGKMQTILPLAGAVGTGAVGYAVAKAIDPILGILEYAAGTADYIRSARLSRRELLTFRFPRQEDGGGQNDQRT